MERKRYDVDRFNRTTARVIEFLCQKAMYEKRPQNEYNTTTLGGIMFWFQITTESQLLKFSSPPTEWDFDKIWWDMDEMERVMLIRMGINIEQ